MEGTNKVTANLNIPASSNPVKVWDAYFTNTAVPPRKAVKNNATVTKADGKITLEIPVNNSKFCIYANQDLSIDAKGLTHLTDQGVTSLICDNNSEHSKKNEDGYLTDITVDIGTITCLEDVVVKTCEISLDMGELAMTISGFDKEQKWPASFQVNGFDGIGVQTAAARGEDSDISEESIDAAKSMAFGTEEK